VSDKHPGIKQHCGMVHEECDVTDFFADYVQACTDAGVEPLPMDVFAWLAQAILRAHVAGLQTLH
jgi:hypothetical protein